MSFLLKNTRAGYLEKISTLLVWNIMMFMSTGILYVGVNGRHHGSICAPEKCKGLRTRDQYAEIKKKTKPTIKQTTKHVYLPYTVSLTIFCRENANKQYKYFVCL